MLEKSVRKFLPPHWRGVALDAAFVLLNLFLLPFLGKRLETLFAESFQNSEKSFLILSPAVFAVFLWRFAALYLKRVPLQKRHADGARALKSTVFIWILNLGAVLLSSAIIIVLALNALKEIGFGDYGDYDNLIGFTGLMFPLVELFLLYRLLKPLSEKEKAGKQINPRKEIFADLGLFAYLFVWQAFYNFYLSVIAPNAMRSVAAFIGVFALSLVVFLFFYLAPRTVFLLEDAGYKSTWLGISLVFLTSFAAHLLY